MKPWCEWKRKREREKTEKLPYKSVLESQGVDREREKERIEEERERKRKERDIGSEWERKTERAKYKTLRENKSKKKSGMYVQIGFGALKLLSTTISLSYCICDSFFCVLIFGNIFLYVLHVIYPNKREKNDGRQ